MVSRVQGAVAPAPDSIDVARYELVQIDVPEGARLVAGAGGIRVGVEIPVRLVSGDVVHAVTLRLAPISLRDAGFRVIADDANGNPIDVVPLEPKTYRGVVAEWPDSVVAASIFDDGIKGVVWNEGQMWGIQPLGDFGAGPGWHATYDAADVISRGEVCGVVDVPMLGGDLQPLNVAISDAQRALVEMSGNANTNSEQSSQVPQAFPGFGQRGGNWRVAQIGFDADNLFYLANGSSIDATTADIELILNGMAAIYERDAEITYTLAVVRVRSAPGFDPYSATTDSSALLDEFRSHWNSNEGGVTRDVAHLMTGRNLNGDTVGLAFTGVICGNAAYGLSQSRYTTNTVRRIALTAHEVGHNWSSPHCDGQAECGVMCATIGNCTGTSLGVWEVERITGHRDTRNCLTLVTPRPAQVANSSPLNAATRVVAGAQGSVTLSWGAANLASSYRVFFGTTGTLPQVVSQSGTSFATAALAAGTTYRWRIDSVGAGGTTTGVEWSFTTDFAAQVCGTDFTGDCFPDLLWWNGVNGQVDAWRGLGNGSFSVNVVALATVSDVNWRVVGSADFNGDGEGDIIWRNRVTGDTSVWYMQLGVFLASVDVGRVADQDWIVAGAGDFSGDGKADIVWQNIRTGDVTIWELNGVTFVRPAILPRVSDLNWQIVGVGSFGGPTGPDIVWRNARTGATSVWYMSGTTYVASEDIAPKSPSPDVNWQIVATLDLNRDGRSDITWRNALTAQLQSWIMNGVAQTSIVVHAARGDPWRAQGQRAWRTLIAGDVDGDGIRDITWRNANVGGQLFWLMNARANAGVPFSVRALVGLPTVDGAWELAATGDFNRDNTMDLLWRLSTTGQTIMWLMNGTQVGAAIPFLSGGTGAWYVGAVADFNRDERDDMAWFNAAGTSAFVWYLDGTPAPGSNLLTSRVMPSVPVGWRVEGGADFTRDGFPDLVLRNGTTGDLVIWRMNDNVFVEAIAVAQVGLEWSVGSVGDFNGDLLPDIAWRNNVTGDNALWLMNETQFVVAVPLPRVSDVGWRMVR